MTFAIQGLIVTRGIAVGRAVLFARGRRQVAHEHIAPAQVGAEIERLRAALVAAAAELERVRADVPPEAPAELAALLDVHLMLLRDDVFAQGVQRWIAEQRHNAEWALMAELEAFSQRFDAMQDGYLRERKPDIEQVVDRVLHQLQKHPAESEDLPPSAAAPGRADASAEASILVAHDLSPADLLQFAKKRFAGFVTDAGGQASHTAIIARSLDIPAVMGTRTATRLLHEGDRVVIDGDAGVVVVDPSAAVLAGYADKHRRDLAARQALQRLTSAPAVTADGQRIALLANIERPADVASALAVGAAGVGLFRSEFLFMGRHRRLPDETEQYRAYAQAVDALHGLPLTIRSVDLGADKPLEGDARAEHNPALGVRGIRRSLGEPEVFLVQLRAILRAAARGPVRLLIPMLTHAAQIRQTLALVAHAREQLAQRGVACGPLQVGAMIEVPAAALSLSLYAHCFDFLSVGTNDLIQYTLAVDRTDEAVAPLYDPWHPAVLRLLAATIGDSRRRGKEITVCGELAGDPEWTDLLLGMGLRSFSMHPARLLAVKQRILTADTRRLEVWAKTVVESDDAAALRRARDADPGAELHAAA